MAPESNLYLAMFDDIRLWWSRFDGDRTRTKVLHESLDGDDHVVQDRGRVHFKSRCTVLFDYMRGDTLSPLERLWALMKKCDGKTSYVLTHPIEGSFMASAGPFTYAVDADGTISSEIEFWADGVISQAVPAGLSGVPASGIGAIDAAVAQLQADLADAQIPDPGVAAASAAAVDSWNSGATVSGKKVAADTGSLSSRIGAAASKLTGDMDTWQSFKSYIFLGQQLVSSASAIVQDRDFLNIVTRVSTDTNLRALLASEYGADKVEGYYQRVIDINDITTPGIIPKGTPITLPREKVAGRNG